MVSVCVFLALHVSYICVILLTRFVYPCMCAHNNPIYKFSDDNLVIQRCVSGARGEGSF